MFKKIKKIHIFILFIAACFTSIFFFYSPVSSQKKIPSSFTAAFPTEPVIEIKGLSIPGQDSTLPYTEYHSKDYSVSFATLPDSLTKWSPHLVLSGALKFVTDDLTLMQKYTSSCQGFPALAYEGTTRDGFACGKLVLIGNTLYKIEAFYQNDRQQQEAENFIESFNPSLQKGH